MVAALDDEGGIGREGDLPWRIPADMRHFVEVTRAPDRPGDNAVVMGRVTWESIPERFRPLAGRINVVMTRRPALELPAGVELASGLGDALDRAAARGAADTFVIGGAAIYRLALEHPGCDTLHLTRVAGNHHCDTFFPAWEDRFVRAEVTGGGESNGHRYRLEVWKKRAG